MTITDPAPSPQPAGPSDAQDTASDTAVAKRPSLARRVLLPVAIVLIGLLVMLYPLYATQWNNYQQQKVAELYEESVANMPVEERESVLDKARAYNAEHPSAPILDPWLARISEDNVDYQEYANLLGPADSPMSQVVIPAIDVKLPVYAGTSEKVLQRGLGHLFGTSLPVGGTGTHAVITGHTGLSNATLFDNLDELGEGDAIYVSTAGEKLKYVVTGTQVVLPDETDSLGVQENSDLLTLITCTPYGINTHRLLVHAERAPLDESEMGVFDESSSIMQWWMWALLAAAAIIIAGMIWWIRKEKRKDQQEQRDLNA